MMRTIAAGLEIFFQLYYFILFGRIIMSWVMASGSGGSGQVQAVYEVLYALTEPLLAPLRRVIPSMSMGMGGLDLSPLVLFFILRMVQFLLRAYLN